VAAVLVRDGASLIGVKAVLVGAFLVATAPVLAHVTARTIHTRAGRRR
jgi:multisubunit Na+/H+ antiporter MnhG subunit